MNPHRIKETFRTVLVVTAFAAMLAITPVEISGQGKKPPPPSTTPGPQASKTKLEVRDSEQWGDSVATTSLGPVALRFSTSQPGARTAQWQVSDKPFSTGARATAAEAPHVIASGNLGATPILGQDKTVVINLAQFQFPQPEPNLPRGYWVFVVTKNAQNQMVGLPSAPVRIVHYLKLSLKLPHVEQRGPRAAKLWTLKLTVYPALTNAQVAVKRVATDPTPDVWWADKWVTGSPVRFLQPRNISTKKVGLGSFITIRSEIFVDLPPDIGAGKFEVQVRAKNPTNESDWEKFSIHYPEPPPGEIALNYLGLQSLEETDEVGADEVLVLSTENLSAVDGGSNLLIVNEIGYHTDVDKGETHPRNKTIYVSTGLRTRPTTILLVEIDDDYRTAYPGTLSNMLGSDPMYEELRASLKGKSGKALLTPMLQSFIKGKDDDLVTVIDLPLWAEDLRWLKQKSEGVRKEVVVAGDGGRFKLFFQLLARPKGSASVKEQK